MFSERLAIGTTSGDVELIYPFGDDASIVCNCSSTSKLTKIAWYNSSKNYLSVHYFDALVTKCSYHSADSIIKQR